jgi:hypothetical protein
MLRELNAVEMFFWHFVQLRRDAAIGPRDKEFSATIPPPPPNTRFALYSHNQGH